MASNTARETGRVLVAEDDKAVRDSLVRALTFEGYDVVTAAGRRRGADGGARLAARRDPARRADAPRRRPHARAAACASAATARRC